MQQLTEMNLKSSQSLAETPSRVAALLQREGAVILRNVVDVKFAGRLRASLIRALDEDAGMRSHDYLFRGMVHALMTRGQAFLDLLEVSGIRAIMEATLGHGCIVHGYNSSSMPPAGTNYSRAIHVDCPRLIPGYITNVGMTLALDPFTSENGAMEIAPTLVGQSTPPTESQFDAAKLVLDNLEVGDAVIFNARCWHRGGINRTTAWRHAATINVCRAYMRQQFDFPRMIPPSVANHLTESLRQFLGYYVRMPASMEEFLLPAEQRLYRAGQE